MIAFPSFRGCLGSVQATAWSPQDLSPIIWVDPSDSSTIFDATSGGSTPAYDTEIYRITNKASGYSSYQFLRNTTSGGLIRRQGDSGTNYKDYMSGNAALQGLQMSTNDIGKGAAGVTAFAVCKCSANPSTTVAFFWAEVTSGGGLGRVYLDAGRTSSKLGILSRRIDSGSSTILATSTSTPSNWNVFGGKFDFYDNACSTYVNSTTANSTNSNAYGSSGTNCANTTTGTVYIGEIIVVNRSLTSSEMTSVVDYLNNKW
jgi:hypothetical protein